MVRKHRLSIADMYCQGILFEKDYTKAADLYEKEAHQASGETDLILYYMYLEGAGFEQNKDLANKYLIRAAIKGNTKAKSILRNKM